MNNCVIESGYSGCPSPFVKTKPVSVHAEPITAWSDICCLRCARSTIDRASVQADGSLVAALRRPFNALALDHADRPAKALGFRHVRTANVPGRMSGALFERDLDV